MLLNIGKNATKKETSVGAIALNASSKLLAGVQQIAFHLPENCILTGVSGLVTANTDAGGFTLVSVDESDAPDGVVSVLVGSQPIGAEDNQLPARVWTGTGMRFAIQATNAMTVGKAMVVVEFIEPTLSSHRLLPIQ